MFVLSVATLFTPVLSLLLSLILPLLRLKPLLKRELHPPPPPPPTARQYKDIINFPHLLIITNIYKIKVLYLFSNILFIWGGFGMA